MSDKHNKGTPVPAPRTSKTRAPVPLPRKLLYSLRRSTSRSRSLSLTEPGSDNNLSLCDERRISLCAENVYEGVNEQQEPNFTPNWDCFNPEIHSSMRSIGPFGTEFEHSRMSGRGADWDVFSSISFQSPLAEGEDSTRSTPSPDIGLSQLSCNENEYYNPTETSPSPPRYTPPPLPDISIYDCLPEPAICDQDTHEYNLVPEVSPCNLTTPPAFIPPPAPHRIIQQNDSFQPWAKPCRISVVMEFDPLFTSGPAKIEPPPLPHVSEPSPNTSVCYEYVPNRSPSQMSTHTSANNLDKFNMESNVLYEPNLPLNIIPENKSFLRRFTSRRSHRRDSDTESTHSDSLSVPNHMPCIRREQQHSSTLYRASKSDFVSRWCMLRDGRLQSFHEKPSSKLVEDIPLERLITISIHVQSNAISPSLHDLQCFALSVIQSGSSALSRGTVTPPSIVWGATTEQQRRKWMQLLLESLTGVFPSTITAHFQRGGWGYIKEGITSTWSPGWLLLKGRSLHFCLVDWNESQVLDLRKARKVALQPSGSGYRCHLATISSEVLVLDCEGHTLYLQWETDMEAHEWKRTLKEESLRNGLTLDDMQITKDNVPVIVDRCLKFVYTHGLLQEGLYRVNGSNSRVVRLLQMFHNDAWAVQLSPEEFTAHDVACTLKRFFRMLPEPLLTRDMRTVWMNVADTGVSKHEINVDVYRDLVARLPLIHRNTLRALLAHLHAVSMQHEKNRMPIFNLAPIWGPTLMSGEPFFSFQKQLDHNSSMHALTQETCVIQQLIESYPLLFDVTNEEIEREKKIQDALKRLQDGQLGRKVSGDVRVWIHIQHRNSTPLSVMLAPSVSAEMVCKDLIKRAKLQNHPHVSMLSLFEEVGVGALERPLHPSESVLDTVLRWSNWCEDIRKDCAIVMKLNNLYSSLLSWARPPLSVFTKLRYADWKSKSYKKHEMAFSHARLVLHKDNKPDVELGAWNVEDIIWFIGCEARRPAPTKWVFTFLEKNATFNRTKETPYFGCSVACSNEDDFLHWIAAMLVGEHPHSFMPPGSTMA